MNINSGEASINRTSPYNINNSFVCNYVDESYFSNLNKTEPSLFLVSLNIQSLMSKKEKLSVFNATLDSLFKRPDVIGIQETHLNNFSHPPNFNGYHPLVHRCRDSSRGGGVGILINENFSFSTNDSLSLFIERVFESIAVDIFVGKKRFTIITIYRPPSSPGMTETQAIDLFLLNLYNILSKTPSNTYVLLDSNINLMSKSTLADRFLDSFMSNGYQNHINISTRITLNSSSLLDQIFSNISSFSGSSGAITSDISDHLPIFANVQLKGNTQKDKKIFKRFFTDENMNLFLRNISNLNWGNVLSQSNSNDALFNFNEVWNLLFEQSFPLKKVFVNRKKYPVNAFFSSGLLKSRDTKIRLYNIFLKNRSPVNELNYKKYRNCFNKTVRAAKKLYFNDKIDKNSDPKSSWRFLKEASGMNSVNKSQIHNISLNGVSFTDDESIANIFNDFFASVTDDIVNAIPPSSTQFTEYLNLNNESSFSFQPVDNAIIEKIINNFESKPSLDINGISTILLKKCAPSLLLPITHIVNLSLSEGFFPDSLKVSRVCPIFKQGSRDDPNNYRPISCLPVFSKIFEKVVYNQLSEFLTINRILDTNQFGFQPNKSTFHPLLHILNYIADAFSNNKFVIAVFLDLRKAFDMVDRDILISKLRNIGLDDIAVSWFRSYLSDRKMFTMVNGHLSQSFRTLVRSVPQGSILGPLLFLIFINDMPKSNNLLNFLFADDTTALTCGTDIEVAGRFVNLELQKIGTWLRTNKLAVNTSKTKIMVFSNKKTVADFNFVFNDNDIGSIENPSLISPLERVSNKSKDPAVKMLGVYLDEHLSFNYHCSKIIKKINSALFHISSVKNMLSKTSLKKLYYAMIHPHFLYCLPIYGFTGEKNLNMLFKKQKQCLRIISKSRYNSHTEPLFFSNEILPLRDLHTQQKLMFMHSLAFNYSAVKFDVFKLNSENLDQRYVLRNDNDFSIPRTFSSFVQKMPLVDFPMSWNNLDVSVKEIPNKLTFKRTLKFELLEKYRDFRCDKTLCVSCMNL